MLMQDMTQISRTPAMSETSDDYILIRAAIRHLTETWRDQPPAAELAAHLGISEDETQRLFRRWAGITPKQFVQAITLDHARGLLRERETVLDTAYEVGLSGPGRLHDLFVTHEAMTPGDYRNRGQGLVIQYGFHPSPFGDALVMATDRGLAGLAFADGPGGYAETLDDMTGRWLAANYVEDMEATASYARCIFESETWHPDQPLRVLLIGSDFQVRVWETLLKIPLGKGTTYSDVARHIGKPEAARAVGAAVGRNPISFVVPCHRVLGKSGALTGYHWGLTRKRAILGWEAGQVGIG